MKIHWEIATQGDHCSKKIPSTFAGKVCSPNSVPDPPVSQTAALKNLSWRMNKEQESFVHITNISQMQWKTGDQDEACEHDAEQIAWSRVCLETMGWASCCIKSLQFCKDGTELWSCIPCFCVKLVQHHSGLAKVFAKSENQLAASAAMKNSPDDTVALFIYSLFLLPCFSAENSQVLSFSLLAYHAQECRGTYFCSFPTGSTVSPRTCS